MGVREPGLEDELGGHRVERNALAALTRGEMRRQSFVDELDREVKPPFQAVREADDTRR